MNIISDLFERLLTTPEIANQLKKALVNRNLSIEIDGKKYQITTRKPTDDDLDNLKAEIWDLRKALRNIVEAHYNFDVPLTNSHIGSADSLLKR